MPESSPSIGYKSFPPPPEGIHGSPVKIRRSGASSTVLPLVLCLVGIGLLLASAIVGSVRLYLEKPEFDMDFYYGYDDGFDYQDYERYEKEMKEYNDTVNYQPLKELAFFASCRCF